MPFASSEGPRIYYDDRGMGEPVLLCLPGWCVHRTMFAPLAERLSAQHRVLVMDWRGHGKSQASDLDFGYAEMITDVVAVIQASGAQSVVPIAQAHGGWVAIELRQRLDGRVPKMIFTSWNPIFTSRSPLDPPHPFLGAMKALGRARWRPACSSTAPCRCRRRSTASAGSPRPAGHGLRRRAARPRTSASPPAPACRSRGPPARPAGPRAASPPRSPRR